MPPNALVGPSPPHAPPHSDNEMASGHPIGRNRSWCRSAYSPFLGLALIDYYWASLSFTLFFLGASGLSWVLLRLTEFLKTDFHVFYRILPSILPSCIDI